MKNTVVKKLSDFKNNFNGKIFGKRIIQAGAIVAGVGTAAFGTVFMFFPGNLIAYSAMATSFTVAAHKQSEINEIKQSKKDEYLRKHQFSL